MHFSVFLLSLIMFSGAALAQTQPKPKIVKLSALAEQEIELRSGLSLNLSCEPLRPTRVAVIKAPANGTVFERDKEMFSNFAKDNPRFSCNEKKSLGVIAVYKSKPDFRGVDKFSFAVVYYDGRADIYDVEMTVWR